MHGRFVLGTVQVYRQLGDQHIEHRPPPARSGCSPPRVARQGAQGWRPYPRRRGAQAMHHSRGRRPASGHPRCRRRGPSLRPTYAAGTPAFARLNLSRVPTASNLPRWTTAGIGQLGEMLGVLVSAATAITRSTRNCPDAQAATPAGDAVGLMMTAESHRRCRRPETGDRSVFLVRCAPPAL
jgi:hypothetical protein